ncbi:hypothetical protein BBJ29_007270 [Phytophthora kernoviae]|uniref:Uncharacterized protein n=1 Tax=Phytophthora kernoviae TaxID=325452 RepID=A0A3F2RVB7_9STRA|nr:hypothetical protein BBP00_00003672 [Phytophthora kernoviae]RLN67257.1 hypothetical protein BBJ29_007270 [Phytophthora kernoviae]
MKAKISSQELSPGLRMETVQEDDEPLGRDGGDEHESDDEFGQFDSDLSDDDVGETVEVDDPMELLWTSFSQADKESRGLLSVAQTRLGVVNALGIGVTTGEITAALVGFKVPHPFNVSFDVFADLVAFFRKGDEDNQDDGLPRAVAANSMPALKGIVMTGPPSPKRQRTGDKPAEANEPTKEELEQIQKVIESVQKVEEELEQVNEEQAKEILAIETKYNTKKRPTYVKRNKLLADIPKFWKQAVRTAQLEWLG